MTALQDNTDAEERLASRLNWLRAGVLGANDGIVSTAALVLGVAGATTDHVSIMIAGLVGLLAGAMSMAAGEYVSVSTQRDSQRAVLTREAESLRRDPDGALRTLAEAYRAKGLDDRTARQVATELTDHDPLAAHAAARYGFDATQLTNPWHAALASLVSFAVGALIPLAGVMIDATSLLTVALVVIALAATGAISAYLGQTPISRAIARNVGGGLAAMAITYGLGSLVGTLVS